MVIEIGPEQSKAMMMRLLTDNEATVIVDGTRIEVEAPTRDKDILLNLVPPIIGPDDLNVNNSTDYGSTD